MNLYKYSLLFIILTCLVSCNTKFEEKLPFERQISINENWRFHLGDLQEKQSFIFDDTAWRRIDLPHDWAIEGAFSAQNASGTGYLPGGIGWYQKRFKIPENIRDKRLSIIFDGAYQNTKVWINGKYLGIRPYGYISFYYDITDHIIPDSVNTVTVKLDHSVVSDSRWYTGNGIYRNVWLVATNKIFVETWGSSVSTLKATSDSATAHVTVKVLNKNDTEQKIVVKSTILNEKGVKCSVESLSASVAASNSTTYQFSHHVADPELWSPETPVMYTNIITIHRPDGKILDLYETPFGIRQIKFTPDKGFFCNGKSYKLKGVCMHHDYGALGATRTPEAIYPVLKKLKEAGCNAIRTSHNPEDPEYLNLLDTMGFFVIEEAFDEFKRGKKKWIKGRNVGQSLGTKAYPEFYNRTGYSNFYDVWAKRDIQDMVRRDKNHPSIIMWSIGNETDYPNDPYQDPNVKSTFDPTLPPATEIAELVSDLVAWIKEIDTTRAVTQALANTPVTNAVGVPELLDVVGYNYLEHYYEKDHQKYPDRIIFGSENDDSPNAWKAVRDNEYILGQFLWTGMDYHGEAGIFTNHSFAGGLIDYCGFEKPEYFMRKSFWTDDPVVKLALSDGGGWNQKMHMNWPEGKKLEVTCYTNCEEAELFLNGMSLGKKKVDQEKLIITWNMTFSSGTLSVNGLKDGKIICTEELMTAGKPLNLVLKPIVVHSDKFNHDLIQVEVNMVDKNNTIAPGSISRVEFSLEGEGEILGVCNSNYKSIESYKTNSRLLYEGRCLVIIKAKDKKDIKLNVRSVELDKEYVLSFNDENNNI